MAAAADSFRRAIAADRHWVLNPGDRVLMCETGQFAVLWRGLAEKLGFDVDFLAGDWRRGAMSVGQSCGFADVIEPVEAIFDRIIADAVRARDRVTALGAAEPSDT